MGTPTQTPAPEKKRISARTAVLVAAAACLVLFAAMNTGPVTVWPIGQRSLIVVILISFALGALIGWLSRSLASRGPRGER